MRDGRVLFASAEIALPAAVREVSRRPVLYLLEAAARPSLRRLFPASLDPKLPARTDLFELSPDETRLAVSDGKGQVCVVSISGGDFTVVPGTTQEDLRTIPVWRNDGQLCFLLPASAARPRDAVVLWSPQGTTVLSRDWPDDVVKGIR